MEQAPSKPQSGHRNILMIFIYFSLFHTRCNNETSPKNEGLANTAPAPDEVGKEISQQIACI